MPDYLAGTMVGAQPAATDQMWLDLEPPPGFREAYGTPGQFCKIRLGGDEGYFAMYSAPGEAGPVRFLLRVGNPEGGECADRLAAAAPNQLLDVTLPLGKGFRLDGVEDDDSAVCLVGTGTGIAPVRAALEVLLAQGVDPARLTLDHGLRSEDHLALDAVDRWRGLGVDVRLSYSTFESGEIVGRTVQEALFESRESFADVHLLVVGQDSLLADLRARFEAAGGRPERFLSNV